MNGNGGIIMKGGTAPGKPGVPPGVTPAALVAVGVALGVVELGTSVKNRIKSPLVLPIRT